MHNPPHPGEVLRDGVITDTGISVTDFAVRLGVTRVALSRVLNSKAGISADMAVRLAAALGGSAQSWLHMQANCAVVGREVTPAGSRQDHTSDADSTASGPMTQPRRLTRLHNAFCTAAKENIKQWYWRASQGTNV